MKYREIVKDLNGSEVKAIDINRNGLFKNFETRIETLAKAIESLKEKLSKVPTARRYMAYKFALVSQMIVYQNEIDRLTNLKGE